MKEPTHTDPRVWMFLHILTMNVGVSFWNVFSFVRAIVARSVATVKRLFFNCRDSLKKRASVVISSHFSLRTDLTVKNSSYKCELRTTKVSRIKIIFINHPVIAPPVILTTHPASFFCSPVVIVTPQERLEALWYKDVAGLSSRPAKDKQDFNASAGINTFIILHHSHKTALVASMQTALVPCLRWNATQTFLTHQWVSWMGKFWRHFFDSNKQKHRWLKKKKLAILFTAHLPIALYS